MTTKYIQPKIEMFEMIDLFGGNPIDGQAEQNPKKALGSSLNAIAQAGLRLQVTAKGLREGTTGFNPVMIIGYARMLLWLQKTVPSKLNRQIEVMGRLKMAPPPQQSHLNTTPSERVLGELEDVPVGKPHTMCEDVVNCCCRNLEKLGKHLCDLVFELDPVFDKWDDDENYYSGLARLRAFCTAFNEILRRQALLAAEHLRYRAFDCHAVIKEVVRCAVYTRLRRER